MAVIVVSIIILTINLLGILIGFFTIFVTFTIVKEYQIVRSYYFIFTSSGITIWNLVHLCFQFISPSNEEFARYAWSIGIISGILMVISVIIGFHLLGSEGIEPRILIYVLIIGFYSGVFLFTEDWFGVKYTNQRWETDAINEGLWLSFSLVIALMIVIDIEIPMINAIKQTGGDQKIALIAMIIGINLALFSNALLPIKSTVIPPETRYLVADIGFLLFFIMLFRYPFVGIYDPVLVHQVIIAKNDGDIIHSLTTDKYKAILTSGAIIGVNTVLQNMSRNAEPRSLAIDIGYRKLEFGIDNYFVAKQGIYIIIFHFSNGEGVCFQKFKSLARILETTDQMSNNLIKLFQLRFSKFFPFIKI